MNDGNIEKKINFDYGLGRNVDKVDGTPSVYVNGEKMNMDEGTFDDVVKRVEDKINSELEKNSQRKRTGLTKLKKSSYQLDVKKIPGNRDLLTFRCIHSTEVYPLGASPCEYAFSWCSPA